MITRQKRNTRFVLVDAIRLFRRDHTSQNHFCSMYFTIFAKFASKSCRDEEVRRRLLSVKKLMGPMWHTQLDDRWNCVFYVGPLELTLAERSDFGKLYLNSIGSGNGAAFQANGVVFEL
uniref:WS_DGAT_C domain-containing protein n=1 Tax=Syphacia muris TaxID=451379 RepID=A0A0N5AQ32_9BILA